MVGAAWSELEQLELQLLLTGVYEYYGYDFRNYAPNLLRRRIRQQLHEERLASISGLLEKILHDRSYLDRFRQSLCVTTTSIFRDPAFFLTFRKCVVPLLKTYPSITVWLAGCATGEEAYSMAILLREEGLAERSRIYATDVNDEALATAQAGTLPLTALRESAANYRRAAGRGVFSRLYTVHGDQAVFSPELRKNITFAQHNLATDQSFNEFSVILCRNVMIYFAVELKKRVHDLLYHSLSRLGFLGLGEGETVEFTPHMSCYRAVEHSPRLFRKVC